MKILVTGRQGQLARSLVERGASHPEFEVIAAGRPELDLEIVRSAVRLIEDLQPDLVVNAAAYTAVDMAEQEPDRAFRVNAEAAGEIAQATADAGARIIQVSTDYVFNGISPRPWRPNDETAPLGIYGASKLKGEEQVRAANAQHLILRTSWVFSPVRRNFVSTMLRLADDRDEVRVVADQHGCPTSALDLADAILAVAVDWRTGTKTALGSTLHVAGAGACSWAEFAQAIFEVSTEIGGPTARVLPITSAEYPTPARRPAYSVLDCADFEEAFGWPMRRWRAALPDIVRRILRAAA